MYAFVFQDKTSILYREAINTLDCHECNKMKGESCIPMTALDYRDMAGRIHEKGVQFIHISRLKSYRQLEKLKQI